MAEAMKSAGEKVGPRDREEKFNWRAIGIYCSSCNDGRPVNSAALLSTDFLWKRSVVSSERSYTIFVVSCPDFISICLFFEFILKNNNRVVKNVSRVYAIGYRKNRPINNSEMP